MPFDKYHFRRKYGGSKYRKKGLSKKQKSEVRQIAYKQGEQKWQPHSWSATAIDSTTGVNKILYNIDQGVGPSQRVGAEINVDRFILEGVITFPDSTNVVRCVLAAFPSNTTNTLLSYCSSVYQEVDWADNGVKVFRDFLMTGGANGPTSKHFKLNVPFKRKGRKGMKIEYTDADGDNVAMGSRRLCLFFISDSTSVSHPLVVAHGRLYYHDN